MGDVREGTKTWVRALAPLILVLVGALLAAAGLQWGFPMLFWGGLIVAGCGVLWGALWLLPIVDLW